MVDGLVSMVGERLRYRVAVEYTFDAAHYIKSHKGKCSGMHGHTYVVRVVAEGPLNPNGMVMDMTLLKALLRSVCEKLDHSVINEVLGIEDAAAEVIAHYIYQYISNRIAEVSSGRVRVVSVRVYESPTQWAEMIACD